MFAAITSVTTNGNMNVVALPVGNSVTSNDVKKPGELYISISMFVNESVLFEQT